MPGFDLKRIIFRTDVGLLNLSMIYRIITCAFQIDKKFNEKLKRSVPSRVFRGSVRSGKCPVGDVSIGDVSIGDVSVGDMSGWGSARSGMCPSGMCPSGMCPDTRII